MDFSCFNYVCKWMMSLFCLICMHTHVFSLFTCKQSYLLGWNAAHHIYNRFFRRWWEMHRLKWHTTAPARRTALCVFLKFCVERNRRVLIDVSRSWLLVLSFFLYKLATFSVSQKWQNSKPDGKVDGSELLSSFHQSLKYTTNTLGDDNTCHLSRIWSSLRISLVRRSIT